MITQTAPGEQLAGADWAALTAELDAAGCARTPRLLTPAQCRDLAGLYDEPERFRATIDMARHRFGSGQYRYFTHDLPGPVRALREAFYPRLLVIARDSPPATVRSAAPAAGPPPRSGTASARSAPAAATRSASCSTTPDPAPPPAPGLAAPEPPGHPARVVARVCSDARARLGDNPQLKMGGRLLPPAGRRP